MRGSTTSIAATSGARSRRTWSGSAARSRAPTSAATARPSAAAGTAARRRGTACNTPPPTQGLASLIILGLFERAASRAGRKLRTRSRRSSRRPSAPSGCATPMSPTSTGCPHPPDRYLDGGLPRRAKPRRSTAQGSRVAAADGRGRHDLDGRDRRLRPGRLLHPVALLGIRLGLRAAAHRRADAEPRRELRARPARRREPARARPPSGAHAQPGARGAARRPRHGVRHHGGRRPAADPGCAVHAACRFRQPLPRGDRPAALAARPYLGLLAHQPAGRGAVRRGPRSIGSCPLGTTWRRSPRRIPTSWAMPVRWWRIPTERSKARTTPGPTAAPPDFRFRHASIPPQSVLWSCQLVV